LDIGKKHVKRFTSSGLAMVAHAFDFMANINIDYWTSWKVANITLDIHTLLLFIFLGCQKTMLITSKCLLKLYFESNSNQYFGYTTLKLSMMPWGWNFLWNFARMQSIAPTTHIIFWFDSMQNKMDKIQINKVNTRCLGCMVKLAQCASTCIMVVA
jgi:hypothetical protein